TRDCLDPWVYAEIDANGDVKPCCARPSVGNLAQGELIDILDGEPIRQLRSDLLNGTTDWHCTNCRLRRPIKAPDLQLIVRDKLQENRSHANTAADFFARHSKSTWLASLRTGNLLKSALMHLKDKRPKTAWVEVCTVLGIDPGITSVVNSDEATIRNYLNQII